jgi:hypothetical protein
MSRCLLVSGAPLAAPIASSQERHTSLRDGRFWRITPGALSAVAVQLSLLTGGRT